MYFVFSLTFSVFLVLSVFLFLVASFDGLRPLLAASHHPLCSSANKLRSFVHSFSGDCQQVLLRLVFIFSYGYCYCHR